MLYYLLRYFNWLYTILGFRKPFIMSSGKLNEIKIYSKCWSLLLMAIYIALYIFRPSRTFELNEKRYNVGFYGIINDMGLNLIIFLIDVLRGDKYCPEIYNIIENIILKLNIKQKCLVHFAIKNYIWFGTPIMLMICCTTAEIFQNSVIKISIVRAPITIALLHLSLHLSILIGIMNTVNRKLTRKLKPRDKYKLFAPKEEIYSNSLIKELKSILEFNNIYFMANDEDAADDIDMKDISLIYYDICRCFKLLEKQHGFQVLCDVWINFTDGVILVCLLSTENVVGSVVNSLPWFLLIRWLQPYIWHVGLAWLNDQIRQEVERTDTLLIKSTIDYRNDKQVSNILDSFSAQVRSNRLKFRACDLFHIDYATILGTFVNVLTYSIIVIQLFIEDKE